MACKHTRPIGHRSQDYPHLQLDTRRLRLLKIGGVSASSPRMCVSTWPAAIPVSLSSAYWLLISQVHEKTG